jgi:WD40 repeat protein
LRAITPDLGDCGILARPGDTMIAPTDPSPEPDLFVLHAEADAGFVLGHLLCALGLDERSPRVMLPAKYELGVDRLRNIERAVRASRFTLLILSHAARGDRWIEIGGLLAQTLGATGRHRLIPLVLDDVPLDLRIEYLEKLDLRDRSQWDAQMARLRALLERPLSPGERLRCPYPGLAAFQQGDGKRFVGRDAESARIVRRVQDEPLLCVIGPSGSGKSSLVDAGVLPELMSGSFAGEPFAVRRMRPGDTPVRRLADVLEGHPAALLDAVAALLVRETRSRLVLFVDQLEELFTLTASDERAQFIAALRGLRGHPACRILTALRADFVGSLMDSELWPDVEHARCELAPLRGEALRAAIVTPASDAGVSLERALVERLVADTAAEPGALPLLQATLLDLWEVLERRARTSPTRYLRLADYDALGDGHTTIATALGRRADAAIASLPPDHRHVARRVLLDLVSFGEGRTHTRRQRSLDALRAREAETGAQAAFDATLDILCARRLVTTDAGPRDPTRAPTNDPSREATIDLSHEALITAWPTLRSWIETGRADEERRRALTAKIAAWTEATRQGFRDAGLLDAVELLDAERWLRHDAARAGAIPGLDRLVEHSRDELEAIRRQRDETGRLLAMSYEERGRQLLLDGRPMAALPYLHAAREVADARGIHAPTPSLAMLFGEAARVLPVAVLVHGDRIDRAALSPDGTLAVTTGRDGSARIWDAATGEIVLALPHDAPLLDARFSPDGSQLATADENGAVRIWTLASGTPTVELRHAAKVHILAFRRDGRAVLTASWDRSARVWDAVTGRAITPPIVYDAKIAVARFSPDGGSLAIAGWRTEVWVCDAATGAVRLELAHEGIVRDATFSPDGARLATASADHTARIWDARTGALLQTITHRRPVTHLAMSPDGQRIVTACDATARVCDTASGAQLSQVIEHRAPISAVMFGDDGACVVTASADRMARLSDAVTARALAPPFEHAREVRGAAIDRAGRRIITTTTESTALVWDTGTAHVAVAPLAHARGFVRSVAFDAAGSRIITAGSDGTARLGHAARGALVRELAHHDVKQASFAPDGSRVLTAGGTRAILWDAETARTVHVLEHGRKISAASFHPGGLQIATADRDGVLRRWDTGTGELLDEHRHGAAITGAWFSPDGAWLASACADHHAWLRRGERVHDLAHTDTVRYAAFDPDGRRLATASNDHTARIWDVESGAPRTPPLLHDDEVWFVAFSPDGTHIVTISDTTVRIWSAASGQLAVDPVEHRDKVLAARFSPGSGLLATAGMDCMVSLWDAATGRRVGLPLIHDGRVNDLAFDPSGRRLATASGDSIVRIWHLPDHRGSLAQWSDLIRRCPYELVDGVLVERRRGRELERGC